MPRRIASRSLLSRFQREIERLFQEALELAGPRRTAGRWQPRLDVVETDEAVQLVLEVPGFDREDLEVEIEGGEITVQGTGPAREPAPEGTRFLCVERERGTFERRVKLFWPVNSHQGRAWLADGLLILQFPKIEDRRQRSQRLDIDDVPPGSEDCRP